jgi:hypothetical protein
LVYNLKAFFFSSARRWRKDTPASRIFHIFGYQSAYPSYADLCVTDIYHTASFSSSSKSRFLGDSHRRNGWENWTHTGRSRKTRPPPTTGLQRAARIVGSFSSGFMGERGPDWRRAQIAGYPSISTLLVSLALGDRKDRGSWSYYSSLGWLFQPRVSCVLCLLFIA